MLRFNSLFLGYRVYLSLISIHPMLRFNKIMCVKYFTFRDISIHPMLRFNDIVGTSPGKIKGFQYILCYGSTCFFILICLDFSQFQYILCYGSTPLVLCDLYFSSYLNSIEIATFVIDFSNEDQVFYQRKKCSKTIEIPTCIQTPTDS